jgi:restriction system protein
MARRQAAFTDLLEFSAKLPWQVAAGLAVASFAVLHVLTVAFSSPVAATSIADMGKVVIHSGIHTLAYFLQFIMPVGFAFGAVASVIMRSRSGALIAETRANPGKSLASMRWRDFERLVGEGFRAIRNDEMVNHAEFSPARRSSQP